MKHKFLPRQNIFVFKFLERKISAFDELKTKSILQDTPECVKQWGARDLSGIIHVNMKTKL